MSLDRDLSHLSLTRDSAVSIGMFDGVHRGHRHLIDRLVQEARRSGLLAGVVTFRNHPLSVLKPDADPIRLLTDVGERERLLEQLGVDFVVPVTFDHALAQLSSRAFLARLHTSLRMRHMVVGPDFAMGRNRDGTLNTLPVIGQEIGFGFASIELMTDSGGAVKSTKIRQHVAKGDVSGAAALLGRNFSISGVVGRGQMRGRQLGFPTANLEVPSELVTPADGIYAAWAHTSTGTYRAATSIGLRPTFDDGTHRTIEAYLLDFSADLYEQPIRLEFVRRLRDEEKYDTIEELLRQIELDVQNTRKALECHSLDEL